MGVRPFSWEGIWVPKVPPWEVAFRAAVIYLVLIAVFRLVPRKELGRYAISDIIVLFLVTTAVRRSIVVDDDSLTTAIVGLLTIFAVDLVLNVLARKGPRWSDWIQGQRQLLVLNGEIVEEGLSYGKMTVEELYSRLRASAGIDTMRLVKEAYLERDGKVTFVIDHAAVQAEGSSDSRG